MKSMVLIFMLAFTAAACTESMQNAAESQATVSETLAAQNATTLTFEQAETGEIPPGWSYHFGGKGALGRWEIRQDDGNKVLAQVSAANFGSHFNLAVWEESNARDPEISVRFKGVAGEEDQGGGPVWRYRDANNYYIARANPLENNFRVYKVVEGNRIQLASADLDIPSGAWHTITIRMTGDHIECSYDGRKYLDVHDGTFKEAGKIGLWSKADAVTYFDDLQLSVL